jgi:NhaB family Na+:H+ antiporter
VHNFPVILLLMFMVAGIHFMKDLLLFLFSRMLGCAPKRCWR